MGSGVCWLLGFKLILDLSSRFACVGIDGLYLWEVGFIMFGWGVLADAFGVVNACF